MREATNGAGRIDRAARLGRRGRRGVWTTSARPVAGRASTETKHGEQESQLCWFERIGLASKPPRPRTFLFDCHIDLSAAGSSFGLSCPDRNTRSTTCMQPFAVTTVWTRIARPS